MIDPVDLAADARVESIIAGSVVLGAIERTIDAIRAAWSYSVFRGAIVGTGIRFRALVATIAALVAIGLSQFGSDPTLTWVAPAGLGGVALVVLILASHNGAPYDTAPHNTAPSSGRPIKGRPA